MDNSLNQAPGGNTGVAGSQIPQASSWWDVIKMLCNNPFAHPSCAAVFGIAGANMMTPAIHNVVSTVLPCVPEVAAVTAACIGAASVARSGVTVLNDSFAIAKNIKPKAERWYAEYQANRALPHASITVGGVIASAIAGGRAVGKTVEKVAKEWTAPFAEGYRNSRTETVSAKEVLSLSKDSFCEFVAGGRNGEKAAKNAMSFFTGLAGKVTGAKTASAATVIAIFAGQGSGPLGQAAACAAVGAFVAGALGATVHLARERLEKGNNTGGEILASGLEIASILGTAGALGAAAATPKVHGAVRSVVEKAADAYNSHPAVQEVVETAREYIHKAMSAGADRASAIENFMSTHALLVERAHKIAAESLSESVLAVKEAGEFVMKHTVESPLMETKIGELLKETAQEKIGELVLEKIEEEVERGKDVDEKPAALMSLSKKFGIAFGKLVDLGPKAVEYIATSVPPLALSSPQPPVVSLRHARPNPIGYGAGGLAAQREAPRRQNQKHMRS